MLNVPGKHLITADAESKAPLTDFPNSEEDLYKTADVYACEIQAIQKCQTEDTVCKNLMHYCNTRWPSRKTISSPTVKLLQIFQK